MAYLPATMEQIVRLGGNVEICESAYTPETLKNIVRIAKSNDSHVTIETTADLPATLEELVRIGGSNVTIRFKGAVVQ